MGNWEESVTIALLGGAFLFAQLYASTDEINKFLKYLFLFAALISGISCLAIQEDIINSSAPTSNATILATVVSNYNMQVWVFRIVIAVLLLWIIYATAMATLGKSRYGEEDG